MPDSPLRTAPAIPAPRGRPVRPGRGALRYEIVIDLIERLVAEGPLAPGSILPTNRELAEMAGVSLITVRRAVDECARAGLVVSHQGVGTFVAPPRLVSSPARAGGLLHTLIPDRAPVQLTTRVLAVEQGQPSATIARALRISRSEPVWRVERLRLIRSRPMILEQAVIPLRLAPVMDLEFLGAGGSLYQFISDHFGVSDANEETLLEVTRTSRQERRLLRLREADLVARIRGLSLDDQGVPFDAFMQVYAAQHFTFYLSGDTTRQLLEPADITDWEVRSLSVGS